jgi:carotenoid cleavage dioxygenase-like enzyme
MSVAAAPSSPFLAGNYAPVSDELAVEDLPIEGRLPPGLRGTLYRNGPNPQHPPAPPYHWFTGDGMIHAITLGDGAASYRNRWVRTPRFEAERKAGAPLFAGFGRPLTERAATLDTGVANTHVLAHAQKLLALEEAHLPVRLDPGNLATLGYDDFGGGIAGQFTAHPKRDPGTGELVFFSYSATGPLSAGMSWGLIDVGGRVTQHEMFEAPYCAMVHDFAVTARHVVFPILPLTGDMARARAGGPAFAWEPARGGFLGVLRRDKGVASLAWSEIEPRYVFHVMNAFDEGEDVVVDLVEYDSAPLFPRADGEPPAPPVGRLARWWVDPGGKRPVRREVLDGAPGEFPRIDDRRAGLKYRCGYRISPLGGPQNSEAIVVHDLVAGMRRVFQPAEDGRPGEAVFVPAAPDAPEGEGFLLTVVYRPVRDDSALIALDAQAVDAGPVATVTLPRRVPFGFHGSWRPAA